MKTSLDLTPHPGEMLKPRELIELHGTGPLTLQDRRVFNTLVENAWGPRLGQSGQWFEIDTGQLRSQTDRNTRLADSLTRLMRTICLVIKDDGKVELRTALLSSNEIHTTTNGGKLRYKFTEELAELLKDSTIFAKLDLEVMRSFSSKYAFSLYEAVARRARMKHRFTEELDLEALREMLGVEEGRLTSYKNLNVRAIQPAVTEVNSITPYDVSIVPKKKGRKVVGFVMGWNMKSEEDMKAAYAEMHRHSVGRRQRLDGTEEGDV
mgnify:CR=1 FL=1